MLMIVIAYYSSVLYSIFMQTHRINNDIDRFNLVLIIRFIKQTAGADLHRTCLISKQDRLVYAAK